MSIFYNFIDRAETYTCTGKTSELIIATRKGRTYEAKSMNNNKMALLQDDTAFDNGDLITNSITSDKYFIVGKQSSTEATQAHLYKINAIVDIIRLVDKYNGTNKAGQTESSLFTSQPSVQTVVTANMHLYDSGLLSTTTRKLLLPVLTVKKLDRIKFNDENFQIDSIDDSSYENLIMVQVSQDNRKIV